MPELAELKLTSDFVNSSVVGKNFFSTWKNPVHKLKDLDLSRHLKMDENFSMVSSSRGKELLLRIFPESSENFSISFTMGMGGHFKFGPISERPKHTHFSFICSDGINELQFVDVRRFGRWRIGDWHPDRSPDLTYETELWKNNILDNISGKDFDRPFYEWLMNQKWMNGYGNYLRAELCQRMDIDPFLSARQVINNYQDEFFSLAPILPGEAYLLGGGQLYSWVNPFSQSEIVPGQWSEWMKAYKNPAYENIIDRNGRRFWYHPKWNNQLV
jgi:endonuclease VIII-like 1